MQSLRGAVGGMAAVLATLAVCTALAQNADSTQGPEITSPRGQWQRRVTQRPVARQAEFARSAATRTAPRWSPSRDGTDGPTLTAAVEAAPAPVASPAPALAASPAPAPAANPAPVPVAPPAPPRPAASATPKPPSAPRVVSPEPIRTPPPVPAPELNEPQGDMQLAPLGTPGGPFVEEEQEGPACEACGHPCTTCDACGEAVCPDCGCHGAHCRECFRFLFRHVALFGGVQGFKGPMDLGRNGNFGFHEGLNWSGPLGDPWHSGYQIGIRGVHSDFLGNQVQVGQPGGGPVFDDNSRDQIFVTAGVFRRALEGGLQGGAVFDYLHDNYYDQADLKQVRSEASLVAGPHELGFFGSFDVGGRIPFGRANVTPIQANDIYSLFYRRYFSGGGQGRIWAGASGHGEFLVGAEATVPLGSSWALENSFVYLVPDQQQDESWSVAISLVWYPGRASRCVYTNPYTALFNVADNGTFLLRRQGPTQ